MSAASWLITAYLALLLVALVPYVIALQRASSSDRPLTRTYDRFGRILGLAENPDYRENLVDEDVEIETPLERLAITEAPLPEDERSDAGGQSEDGPDSEAPTG